MKSKNKEKGKWGERIAQKLLEDAGYEIIEENYLKKSGEIDIICSHKGTLVFVEVKARWNLNYGEPLLAVDRKKQIQIVKTAMAYIAEHDIKDKDIRFDVVSILFDRKNKVEKFEIVENAFDGNIFLL